MEYLVWSDFFTVSDKNVPHAPLSPPITRRTFG